MLKKHIKYSCLHSILIYYVYIYYTQLFNKKRILNLKFLSYTPKQSQHLNQNI